MKGNPGHYNVQSPKSGTAKGGGGTTMKTSKPNGDQNMPTGSVDKNVGWKGDGGRDHGKIKGC